MHSIKPENPDNKLYSEQKIRPEDELFIQDAQAALLSRHSSFATWILYTILLMIMIFFLWAFFFSVEESIIGDGKVIPASKMKIIQSLDGGIVADIPVIEGQMVKKGQILLTMDNTRDKADYRQKYKAYLALLAKVSRLKAEAFKEKNIQFPSELYKENPELVKMELNLFNERKESLKNELEILDHQADIIKNMLKMYESLIHKGYASKIEYLTAQRQLDQIKVDSLQKINNFNESVWKDLNQFNAELHVAKEGLIVLEDKLQDTIIYSPVNGVINKINVNTIGGTITPGMNIMEIFPLNDTLLIEVKIKPRDIAFIHLGQKANVKITAYDYTIYGSLDGEVTYISTNSIEQRNPNNTTDEYYTIHVKTTRNYLGTTKHKLLVMPGMIATVQIVTGKQVIIHYLLKPFIKAKEEALRER